MDALKKVLVACKRAVLACGSVIHCGASAYGLVASNRTACSGRRAGLPDIDADAGSRAPTAPADPDRHPHLPSGTLGDLYAGFQPIMPGANSALD
jgi:hypothetical protein